MTRNTDTHDGTDSPNGTTTEEVESTDEESASAETPTGDTELSYDSGSVGVRYQVMPTIRPVLVVFAAVLGGGVVSCGLVYANPGLLGGPELAEIFIYAVGILVTVISIRLAIKILVLSRTQYTIRDDAFQREYELAYRKRSREIPVSKLRGHEYSQGRIQSILGYGTVRLLTAGTNRSLGFVEFEHLDDPRRVREEIRTLTESEASD